jgi:glyoxylase-like metal-dependent hydrolase (beta-lactamase superfamily II)
MRHFLLGVSVLLYLVGCAAARPPESSGRKSEGTSYRLKEDARVGVYTSKPWGFSTHSYWIEGPEGLVVIDTQFLPSAAREVIALAEQETGKKVVLAVVLHPNPDKFNGTPVFQERGIRVVTSRQVAERIPAVFELRSRWFQERYAPDWPTREPRPEVFGSETAVLEAAGLKLKAHVLGRGCSDAQVVVEWEGHLFPGDMVANGTHAWLELGYQREWLRRLEELEALKPRFVHPGRGEPGGPELLAKQRAYLQKVIELVNASGPTLPVRDEAVAALVEQVKAVYPDLSLEVFLRIGMPEVYRSEAERRARGTAP